MVVCGKREVYSDFTLYTQYLILQTSLLFFVVESQEFLPCNSVICILWSRSISKLAGANWVSPMYFPIYDNITKPFNSSAVVASCYIHDGICWHMLWFITEKMTFKNITGKLITWTQLHDFLFYETKWNIQKRYPRHIENWLSRNCLPPGAPKFTPGFNMLSWGSCC